MNIMKTRFDERFENDPTPSRGLVEAYRKIFRQDDHEASLAAVHYRGTREEFDLGVEYCGSTDADDRATGADVLAQLGWGDQTFLDESVDVLIPLLRDSDPHVVYSAAAALGHRGDPRAIAHLVPLAAHPDALVRYGVVFGLTGYEDADAIATLIKLTTDSDPDVRDWALFGIGSQIEVDAPAIREALFAGLSDNGMEARGEALVGLAVRGDEWVIDALLKEWEEQTSVGILSIEAAEAMADKRLLPFLEHFETTQDFSENEYFHRRLLAAITACRGGVGPGR